MCVFLPKEKMADQIAHGEELYLYRGVSCVFLAGWSSCRGLLRPCWIREHLQQYNRATRHFSQQDSFSCWLAQIWHVAFAIVPAFVSVHTMFETILTMLQIVSQSAVLFDAWQRRNRFKVAYDFLDCDTEIIGRIGSPIGEGCFGRVFALYRRDLSARAPWPHVAM